MTSFRLFVSSLWPPLEYSRVPLWRNILSLPLRSSSQLASDEVVVGDSGNEEVSHQVVRGANRTIVCYHPPQNISYHNTRPFRRRKVWERDSLTEEEITLVRKLREEDGGVWSAHALSRLLNVSPGLIGKLTPATEERRKELFEERQRLKNMRRHARKLYLIERQQTRQKKLKELLATNKYSFPSARTDATN